MMKIRFYFLRLIVTASILAVLIAGCDDASRVGDPYSPPANQSPPTAPTDFSAMRISEVEIKLTWNDRSLNETGFEIFESGNNDTNFFLVATTLPDVEEIILSQRVREIDYYYQIRAINVYGASNFSEIVPVSKGALRYVIDTGDTPVLAVTVSPQDNYIIAGCGDSKVRRYSLSTGTLLQTLNFHTNLVTAVAYSPDSLRFASGSQDETIKVWNTKNARLEWTLTSEYQERVEKLEFSPDSRYLTSGYGNIITWDVFDGEIVKINYLDSTGSGPVMGFAYHPDGEIIALSTASELQFWEVDGADSAIFKQFIPQGIVKNLSFAPDGRTIGGTIGGHIWVWAINYEDSITVDSSAVLEHGGTIFALDFSPDGKYIASGSTDDYVNVWDIESYSLLWSLNAHRPAVYTLTFSNDSKSLITGGGDTNVKVWSVNY